MSYQPKTSLFIEGIESLRRVREGLWDRSLETKEANSLIATEEKVRRYVEADVKVRLAAPKIAAIEAKLIDSASAKSIR